MSPPGRHGSEGAPAGLKGESPTAKPESGPVSVPVLSAGRAPPRQVPTLTEVVDVNAPRPSGAPVTAPAPAAAPARLAAAPPAGLVRKAGAAGPEVKTLSAEQLTQRVLAELQPQIDQLLEQRLREALAPALERLAGTLAAELRAELATAVRDLATQAAAHELARLKNG